MSEVTEMGLTAQVQDELLNDGFAATAARDWATARQLLTRASDLAPDPSPKVLEGLAIALHSRGPGTSPCAG